MTKAYLLHHDRGWAGDLLDHNNWRWAGAGLFDDNLIHGSRVAEAVPSSSPALQDAST